MKLKSGKELSQLEIIKRLNLMGVNYNSDIIGKNYYINLYNKSIQSEQNKTKIKNELEKDQLYIDFYNQKLRKRNECSFEININENLSNTNIRNNKYKKNFNENFPNQNKTFFGDFNTPLFKKIIFSHLCFNAYEYSIKNKNKIEKIYNKFIIPIQAIKKYTILNIYPEIKKGIFEIIKFMDKFMIDKYNIIIIIIFIVLVVYVFLYIKKLKIK